MRRTVTFPSTLLVLAALVAVPVLVKAACERGPAPEAKATRHVRVEVTLTPSGRSWWKRPLPKQTVDGMLVSWGITPLSRGGEVLRSAGSARCPQDPFCKAWSEASTKCRDLFMPEHKDWQGAYACYAANRTLLFDKPVEIFKSELSREVREIEIRFYYRTGRYERRQWTAASATHSSSKGAAGIVKLRFRELSDVDLDVSIELIASPKGDVKDLRIAACRIETGDQSTLLHVLQSEEVRYCSVESEPAK